MMSAEGGGKCTAEELLHGNLLLLKVEPAKFARRTGTELRKDLFLATGNKRAALHILYHIFEVIDAGKSAVDFQSCWPVVDRLHERDFVRIALGKLTELERARILPVGASRRSVLESFGGRKFVDLLLQLSSYALKCWLLRDRTGQTAHDDFITALPISAEAVGSSMESLKLLKIRSAAEAKRYITNHRVAEQLKRSRQDYLSNLWQIFTALSADNVDRTDASSTEEAMDDRLPKALEKLQQVRSSVYKVTSLTAEVKASGSIFDSVLKNGPRRAIVNSVLLGGCSDIDVLMQQGRSTLQNFRDAVTHDFSTASAVVKSSVQAHKGMLQSLKEMHAEIDTIREHLQSESKKLSRGKSAEDAFENIVAFLPQTFTRSFLENFPSISEDQQKECTPCEAQQDRAEIERSNAFAPKSSLEDLGAGGRSKHDRRDDSSRRRPADLEAAPPSQESSGRPTHITQVESFSSGSYERLRKHLLSFGSGSSSEVSIVRGLPSISPAITRAAASQTPKLQVSSEVRMALEETTLLQEQTDLCASSDKRQSTPRRKLFQTPSVCWDKTTQLRRPLAEKCNLQPSVSVALPESLFATENPLSPFKADDTVHLIDDTSMYE